MKRSIVGAHNPKNTALSGSSLKKNISETTIVTSTSTSKTNSKGLKSFINLNISILIYTIVLKSIVNNTYTLKLNILLPYFFI